MPPTINAAVTLSLTLFTTAPSLPLSVPALHAQQPALIAEASRTINDSRGGRGAAFRISSSILQQTRHIDIAPPASFAQSPPDRRYPVVVVLDGEAYLAPVAAVSEELTRHGLIPEAIIVAIENEDPLVGRVHDLTPPGLSVSGSSLNEGGDLFLDFIERELLPAVDKQFRGGLPRALIGHSSGGILATYAAATRPGFRAVVAIDAPVTLGGNWLAKKLIARAGSDRTPLRFAYYQAAYPWPDAAWKTLVDTAPPSWKVHRERFDHEAHETAFMLGAYLGLREVFADYSRLAAPTFPTTSILPYYATVSTTFGAPMIPPKRIVHDVVEDLLMEGRGAAARDAYATLVRGYGSPADSTSLLRQITDMEKVPEPTETVEALLATPAPTPEEARRYIGEWVGETWRRPDMPHQRATLRVSIVDGRVVADLLTPDAPPEFRVRRQQYLKVTPNGLSFGNMNGMRPRGLVLNEGTLRGDTLSGRQRWGGITFNDIPGAPKTEPGFSFTRAR